MSLHIAHLSDTHIGYEAYKARSVSGENQRAVDIARAFVSAVDQIIAEDPELVIHSGDVADRTIIPIRMMLLIRKQLQRLAGLRQDGTRRQLVIVAGNHELPRHRREACFLDLLDGHPGVHVVTRGYTKVTFPDRGTSAGRPRALEDVAVHAIPHDDLKYTDFTQVTPDTGRINIITSHGVAGGSELYVRSLGREFAIPTDVLAQEWDYGALGHWHKRGPVPIVRAGGGKDPDRGRIWYAGSTENMGFGDLKDDGAQRGWLSVTIRPGELPDVERRDVPIRRMVRLGNIDAEGLGNDEIVDAAISALEATETAGAIVAVRIVNMPRERWSVLPTEKIRAAAGGALHLDIRSVGGAGSDGSERGAARAPSGTTVERLLPEIAAKQLPETEREAALAMAQSLLRVEIARSAASSRAAGRTAGQGEQDEPREVEA